MEAHPRGSSPEAQVHECVTQILAQLIDIPAAGVSPHDSLAEDLNLDSLLLLEFLITAEERFSVPIFDAGATYFTSVEDVVRHVVRAYSTGYATNAKR